MPFSGRWQITKKIANYATDIVVETPDDLQTTMITILRGITKKIT